MNSTADLSELPLLADELLSHEYDNEKARTIKGTVPRKRNVNVLRQRRHQRRTIVLTAISSSVTTLAIVLCIWTWTTSARSQSTGTQPFIYDNFFSRSKPGSHSCGNTTSEAIALGCRFDELADLWLPPHCSRAFEEEYLKTNDGGPFLYWADTAGQHLLTNRSLYVGGNTYFSTTRDHLVHCEYNLYRFAQSLKTGEPVGHDGGFSDHMHHCARMLGMFANKAEGIDEIDVTTESGFGYC